MKRDEWERMKSLARMELHGSGRAVNALLDEVERAWAACFDAHRLVVLGSWHNEAQETFTLTMGCLGCPDGHVNPDEDAPVRTRFQVAITREYLIRAPGSDRVIEDYRQSAERKHHQHLRFGP